ncbi:Transposon Tn10 TetD protein [compost metagenome]
MQRNIKSEHSDPQKTVDGAEKPVRPLTRHLDVIRDVIVVMERELTRAWTLKELADQAHLSPSRFSALFSQVVGTSPMNYLVELRLEHSIRLLQQYEITVLEIAEASGFRNLSNFNRLFHQYIGSTPSELRRRMWGEESE